MLVAALLLHAVSLGERETDLARPSSVVVCPLVWLGRHNLDFTRFRSRRGSVGCTASLLRRGPKGSHGSNNFANEQHFLPLCVAGSPVGCVRVAQSFLSNNGLGIRMPITDGGKLVPVGDFRVGFAVGFDPKGPQ